MTEAKKEELFFFLKQNSILKDIPTDVKQAHISPTKREDIVPLYELRRSIALDRQSESSLTFCNDILAALAHMQGEELYFVSYKDDSVNISSLVDEAVKTIYVFPSDDRK